jgi:hypothetical protein
MALITKLNLSNSKVYQATGDTLNLSGSVNHCSDQWFT